MSKTMTADQVLLLRTLVAGKNKKIKWVLENEAKLKKPIKDRAELVEKFGQYNEILPILGGTALEPIVE